MGAIQCTEPRPVGFSVALILQLDVLDPGSCNLAQSVATEFADFLRSHVAGLESCKHEDDLYKSNPLVQASRVCLPFDPNNMEDDLKQELFSMFATLCTMLESIIQKHVENTSDLMDEIAHVMAVSNVFSEEGDERDAMLKGLDITLKDAPPEFQPLKDHIVSILVWVLTHKLVLSAARKLSAPHNVELHHLIFVYFAASGELPDLKKKQILGAKDKEKAEEKAKQRPGILSLEAFMQDLFETGCASDLHVDTGTGRIPVHSFVLIKRSCFFAAQLRGSFCESGQKVLNFTSWSKEVMQNLLRFIYTGKGPLLEDSTSQFPMLTRLCDAAVYFDEPELVEWLQCHTFSPAQLARLLYSKNFPQFSGFERIIALWDAAAESVHADWLARRCESLLALVFKQALAIGTLLKFPPALLKRMLPRLEITISDRATLANALVQYAKGTTAVEATMSDRTALAKALVNYVKGTAAREQNGTAAREQNGVFDEILEAGANCMLKVCSSSGDFGKVSSSSYRIDRSRSPRQSRA